MILSVIMVDYRLYPCLSANADVSRVERSDDQKYVCVQRLSPCQLNKSRFRLIVDMNMSNQKINSFIA